MTAGKALLMVSAVIVVIGAFIALLIALGFKEIWMACIFLWYFSSEKNFNMKEAVNVVLGGLVGILTAYLLTFGTIGAIAFGLTLLVEVYCLLMGWCKPLFNNATFLFLTVATIPSVIKGGNYAEHISVFLIGAICFAGIPWILSKIKSGKEVSD